MSSMADQFLGEICLYLKIVSLIQELEEDKEDPLKKLKANSSVVKCRVCKGDHWTTKCPFKDSLQPLKEIEDKEKAKEGEFCWYFIDVNSYFSVSVKGYQTSVFQKIGIYVIVFRDLFQILLLILSHLTTIFSPAYIGSEIWQRSLMLFQEKFRTSMLLLLLLKSLFNVGQKIA